MNACTVDNPLAKVGDYLSVQAHKPCSISHSDQTVFLYALTKHRRSQGRFPAGCVPEEAGITYFGTSCYYNTDFPFSESVHSLTSGEIRRITNHYKTNTAFTDDDDISVHMLFVSYKRQEKRNKVF